MKVMNRFKEMHKDIRDLVLSSLTLGFIVGLLFGLFSATLLSRLIK